MEHYKLNYETKNIILELKKKAEELQLGNVSFDYYERGNTIKFFITEYKITGNWRLSKRKRIVAEYTGY